MWSPSCFGPDLSTLHYIAPHEPHCRGFPLGFWTNLCLSVLRFKVYWNALFGEDPS